ncbi:hypothetical protein CHS0354_040005 [Potamilus streckersoni]|uniref:Uncharacterized protein n=1 Tax=Potamilus streckersoni TaxID=2493646 RepID=A0AAE0SU24_9BIVA|nr:hypothetical protein CHS0354_040005 [Potamilus streckersoni]
MTSKDENLPSRMKTDVPNTSRSAHYQTLRSDSNKQVLIMGIPSDHPELSIYTAAMHQNKGSSLNVHWLTIPI